MPVPHIKKDVLVQAIQLEPQEGSKDPVVKEICVFPVPQIKDGIAEVTQPVPHEHGQARLAEKIAVTVPQIKETIAEVV